MCVVVVHSVCVMLPCRYGQADLHLSIMKALYPRGLVCMPSNKPRFWHSREVPYAVGAGAAAAQSYLSIALLDICGLNAIVRSNCSTVCNIRSAGFASRGESRSTKTCCREVVGRPQNKIKTGQPSANAKHCHHCCTRRANSISALILSKTPRLTKG